MSLGKANDVIKNIFLPLRAREHMYDRFEERANDEERDHLEMPRHFMARLPKRQVFLGNTRTGGSVTLTQCLFCRCLLTLTRQNGVQPILARRVTRKRARKDADTGRHLCDRHRPAQKQFFGFDTVNSLIEIVVRVDYYALQSGTDESAFATRV